MSNFKRLARSCAGLLRQIPRKRLKEMAKEEKRRYDVAHANFHTIRLKVKDTTWQTDWQSNKKPDADDL